MRFCKFKSVSIFYGKMAGAVENKHSHSLKEALIESLTHVLSSDHEIRLSGENQVKVLEVTEGC